jgi:hypothetical protein
MPLFEVAILQTPTKKEIDEGTGAEKLVYGPKAVVARDQQSAALAALLDTPLDPTIDKNRMNVLVRTFA